ncbi:uncharacterized protein LOC144717304 isoform X1 [Lampetra planeri]
MQPNQVTAMGLISGIIFLTFISMVENNECEDKGQYRAENGFCCQLCPAGNSWFYDCYSDGSQSLCTPCSPGKDYMDVANRDPECKNCSTCSALYEAIQQECTPFRDTVCQCKNGYSKIRPTQSCAVIPNTELKVAITAGIVIFIFLVVVVVGIIMYQKRTRICCFGTNVTVNVTEPIPLISPDIPEDVLKELRQLIKNKMKCSNADVWRQFDEFLPEVYKSISENTFFFWCEMDKIYNIEIFVYWKFYEITLTSARVVFLLKHFIEEGEEMCLGLLEKIKAQDEKLKRLQTLLISAVKCSPTLDPDTAHKDLAISADHKTAKWISDPPDKPDHPDRFDYWTQVLSSESFSSECHCWIVNVGDVDKICIGVAYQSILRKGGDSTCLIGLNSMSWCLRRHEKTYKAWHDKQSTEVEVGEHPRRIGVGLDYDAGILLFYNADNNKHLHTFYSNFSEPLHVFLRMLEGVLTIEPVNKD